MDEDYNIYEYDSDSDLSGLTQELSQTQREVYGDKSEDEANGENYRLLLKSAADLANLSGNQICVCVCVCIKNSTGVAHPG